MFTSAQTGAAYARNADGEAAVGLGSGGPHLRFKVELLSDHSDETSVVQVSYGRTIEHAKAEALALQVDLEDVTGFQIRDLDRSGRIVWSEKRYP